MTYGERYQGKVLDVSALDVSNILYEKAKKSSQNSVNVQAKYLGTYPLILELTNAYFHSIKNSKVEILIPDNIDSNLDFIEFVDEINAKTRALCKNKKWYTGPVPKFIPSIKRFDNDNYIFTLKVPVHKNRLSIDVFDDNGFMILPKDIAPGTSISAIVRFSNVWLSYPCLSEYNFENEGSDSENEEDYTVRDTLFGILWQIHEIKCV